MQGATAGQMAGGIDLTNTGNAACTLRGYPVVQLLSPTGTVITVPGSRGLRRYPKPLTWPRVVIRPGGSASINVISTNWCGPRPAAWRLLLPASGALIIRRGWRMGICDFPSSGSDLSAGPVEPAQQAPKWPLVPIIPVPALHATAGSSVSYVVYLMNAQTRSYRFPRACPSYVERLTRAGQQIAAERHRLNCARAGTVPGHVAVAFATRMHVPTSVCGAASLTWTLDPPFGFSRTLPAVIKCNLGGGLAV